MSAARSACSGLTCLVERFFPFTKSHPLHRRLQFQPHSLRLLSRCLLGGHALHDRVGGIGASDDLDVSLRHTFDFGFRVEHFAET